MINKKIDNFPNHEDLLLKAFGYIIASSFFLLAIKRGSYLIVDTTSYKIYINSFNKFSTSFKELSDFQNMNITINYGDKTYSTAYQAELKIDSRLSSNQFKNLEYKWFYCLDNTWNEFDCNTSFLSTNWKFKKPGKVKLIVKTKLGDGIVSKESNEVDILLVNPSVEIILNPSYLYSKGTKLIIEPVVKCVNCAFDDVKWKWMYLNENKWFSFPLQIERKLHLNNLPIDSSLLKIKLVAEVGSLTFESNESIIKTSSVDVAINNEFFVFENETVNIKPIISTINCNEEDLSYQWQQYNVDLDQWVDVIGKKDKNFIFKANINTNGIQYRLKVIVNSLGYVFYSNNAKINVKENLIRISRVNAIYNIKEGSTLSIVPDISISHGTTINAIYQWQYLEKNNEWINFDNQSGKNLLMSLVPISFSGTTCRLLVDIEGKITSIETTINVLPLARVTMSISDGEIFGKLNDDLIVEPSIQIVDGNESDLVFQWMYKKESRDWQNIKGQINRELRIEKLTEEYGDMYIKLVSWVDGRYFESNISKISLQDVNIELKDVYEIIENSSILVKPISLNFKNVDSNNVVYQWQYKKNNGEWVDYKLTNDPEIFFDKVNYDFNFFAFRLKVILVDKNIDFCSNESMLMIKDNDISIILENDYFFKESCEFLIEPMINFVNDDHDKLCNYQWQYRNDNGEWTNTKEYVSKNIYLDYTSMKWNDLFLRLEVSCLNKKFYSNKTLIHVIPTGSIKISFNSLQENVLKNDRLEISPIVETSEVSDEKEIIYQWQWRRSDSPWINIDNQKNRNLVIDNVSSEMNLANLRLIAIVDNKTFTSQPILINILNQ